jgi:hypothetical protein
MALCPTCQHALPDPPPAHCPNCGAASSPQPSPATARAAIPWDERTRIGFVAALAETTREVLFSPTRFFKAMPTSGGIGEPLLYGLLLGWLGVLVAAFYQALYETVAGADLSPLVGASPELVAALGWVRGWVGFAWQAVFGGVAVAVGMIVWSGIVHVVLLLLGRASRGFEATLRVVAFSQAACLLSLVPFCGALVAWVWSVVAQVIGLSEAHRSSRGAAAAAVLLPFVLLCCCCGALFATLFAGAFGLASRLQ